jgi:hypothetical protein
VDQLRIKQEFLLAYAATLEPQGLAQEFRRFLFARAGAQRSAGKARRS